MNSESRTKSRLSCNTSLSQEINKSHELGVITSPDLVAQALRHLIISGIKTS